MFELSEIFAYNPAICPIAECSNRKVYTCAEAERDEQATKARESRDKVDLYAVGTKPNMKRKQERSSVPLTLSDSLTFFLKELKNDNEERMKKKDEMHQEKLIRFDRLTKYWKLDRKKYEIHGDENR